ncbi:MAG: hypothetical protein IT495_22730 [Gammaproteobacteria bacterium]|nr:hypothetical protein [Gammaproteobacteria bacterium]
MVIGVGYVAIIGSLMFVLLPVVIGALTRARLLDSGQIGIIGAAPMLGMFVGALATSFHLNALLSRRAVTRVVVAMAACYALLGPSLGAAAVSFAPTVLALFASGVAGAALMGIGFAVIGTSSQPDRAFSLWIATQLAVGAGAVPAFGAVTDSFGLGGFAAALAALSATPLAVLPTLRALAPLARRNDTASVRAPTGSAPWPARTRALAASLLFGVGIMIVWAYAEEMGRVAINSVVATRGWMSASLLVGIVAGLVCAACVGRATRRMLVAVGTGGCAVAALLLGNTHAEWVFGIAVIVFAFGWNFAPAPQIGILGSLDSSGRLIVMNIAALKLGYGLGPLVGGMLPGTANYSMHALLGAICLLTSAAILWRLDARVQSLAVLPVSHA